ncbi:NUDIX domain-containing protein [Streptomyces sp. NBC_00669]|uniref:NUDIX hydrolase n=1 Tax=Streptomyces sp. NBC_00669 TaxID=2976011 RepID=UPI002E374E72|nr:NUDIX domain-containing protein [Streptomyces sp. NBC_00669]
MTITARHVRDTLTVYLEKHPEDEEALAGLNDVLDEAGDGITSRKEFRGHVTAGAVLLRPDGRVLTIEHRALHRWLLPGGHLEPEDDTLMLAALRELTEETGIGADDVTAQSPVPLHIDAHPIPANPSKGEPDHRHFDFRFLFTTTVDDVVLQEEEVTGASWQSADTLPGDILRARVTAAASAASA